MAEENPKSGNGSGKERSLDNLKPIKPGEARNPEGSSKKQRREYSFKKWVEENMPDAPKAVYEKLIEKAKLGKDFRFLQEFIDRTEGKVPAKNEHSGPGGGPVEFKVNVMTPEAQAAVDALKKQLMGEDADTSD